MLSMHTNTKYKGILFKDVLNYPILLYTEK